MAGHMTTDHDDDHDAHKRQGLSMEQRIELVERDLRSHSRSLTVLTKTVGALGEGFSDKQLEQLQEVLSRSLAGVGIRIDDQDHVDASREDLRFLRRFRQSWDSAANKVGGTVLVAVVGIGLTIIGMGFWAWLGSHLSK